VLRKSRDTSAVTQYLVVISDGIEVEAEVREREVDDYLLHSILLPLD